MFQSLSKCVKLTSLLCVVLVLIVCAYVCVCERAQVSERVSD